MHGSVLPACMYVCLMHAWCLRKPEKGIGFPGTGVTDGREPPCGCWGLNLGPLEEQPVLLIAEPPLQSHAFIYFYFGD